MNYGCDSGHVFHVSKAGNDANGGLAQQYPVSLANDSKLTIASAVSAASDGDNIIIWPGTYTEQVDLLTATKAINLIGTNREKCIISQNTANPAVKLYAGSTMRNLRVTQAGAGMVVNGDSQDNCQVINCSIVGGDSAIDGLYLSGAKRCIIKGCYIKSGYDSLYIKSDACVENCIIVTNGLASGSGMARAIAIADTQQRTIIRSCIIIAQPSYEKKTGLGRELYQSDRDLYCIHNGGSVILENCILIADGYKPTGAHEDSYSNGHSYCTSGTNYLVAKNCIFRALTDQNVADRVACGINVSSQLINCYIYTLASGTGGAAWDIYSAGTMTVYLVNTRYDSSKVHSNVTLRVLPDDTDRLNRAAKTLLNKAVQAKTTGVIDYYDDDGQTVILTHTPTDGESAITRVPN
ncbi:MAG: hypothetical protein AMJ43_06445 [Coxiella sp. DG_40]|nr:MAG: hypothetical protein AMJ43_06445 [Coxiella sp. DG_40]